MRHSTAQTGQRPSSDSTAAIREPLQLDVLRQNLRHVDIKSKVGVLVRGSVRRLLCQLLGES